MKPLALQYLSFKHLKSVISTFLLAAGIMSLVACSDNGSSSSSSGSDPSGGGSMSVSGGGVKGPLAGAVVTAFAIDFSAAEFKGSVVGTGSTNAQAQIQNLSLPFPLNPPYILEITSDADTTDITTGMAPVITTMRTVITQALLDGGEQIYATPLTTMAVDIAIQDASSIDAASFEAALLASASQVKSTMGFGMDESIDIFDTPPLIDSTTDTSEEQAATAAYRTAVEAVTAIAYEMQQLSSAADANAVLAELSNDLADGVIDGQVGGAASAVYAAPALDVLSQNPATMTIPNTMILVADIEQTLQTETASTGQTTDTSALDSINVQPQPAETNTDVDGDGTLNADDAFPEDSSEQLDTDGDHIGNNADSDDDNDGWADVDDDYPLDSSAFLDPALDRDGDGVVNGSDNCPVIANADQTDTDGNGKGDACSNDADGDGVNDGTDNCPLLANPDQLNTDADAEGNVCDSDDDNDGVLDVDDRFPLDASESSDLDGDNIGDNSDPDADGDGLLNGDETSTNPMLWDTDGDGFSDSADKFPLDPSEALDSDNDGTGNHSDAFPLDPNETADSDGDGVGDNADAFPTDPTETTDTDNDGVGDNADAFPTDPTETTDTDNDGVGDNADAFPTDPTETTDTDNDGVGDNADAFPTDPTETTDTDNDGVGDNADAFPTDPTETTDTDNDGVGDNADAFPTDPTETTDTDNDGVGDNADAFPMDPAETADSDTDGVGDNADNCPALANSDQADNDGDGQGDVCDADDDNDGVLDNFPDNCPFTPNADQMDANNNGIGDACEVDSDGDGTIDDLDNCPAVANADQLDTDGDGQGDACDADDDNDGLTDSAEATLGTNPLLADTDGDTVNDGSDAFPLDAAESADTDGDGVGDNGDNCPLNANADQANNDLDAEGDVCDADDDNDGVLDVDEPAKGTDPFNADTDGDSVGDATDNCPVTANSDQADANNNGIGDACEAAVPDMSGIYLQDYSATSGTEWDGSACQSVLGISGSEFWRFEQNGSVLTVNHMDGDWSYSGNIQADGTFTFSGSDSVQGTTDSFSGSYDDVAGTLSGTWTGQDNTNNTPVCSATFSVTGSKPQAVSEQTVVSSGGFAWLEAFSWWDDASNTEQYEFEYGLLTGSGPEAMHAWDANGQIWLNINADMTDALAYLQADGSIAQADDLFMVDGYAAGTETAIIKPTSAGVAVNHEIVYVDLEEYNLEGKAMVDILGEDFSPGLSEGAAFATGARAYLANISNQLDAYNFWCDDDWDDWFANNLACDNIVALDWVETAPGSGNFDPVPATALTELVAAAADTIGPAGVTPGIWSGNGFDSDDYDINAYLVSDNGSVAGSGGTGGTVHFFKSYWSTGTHQDTGITVAYTVANRGGVQVLEWSVPQAIRDLANADEPDDSAFLFVDTATEAAGFGNIVRRGEKFSAGAQEQELLFNSTALDQFKTAFSYTAPVTLPAEFVAASGNGVNFTTDSVINLGSSFGVAGFGILREWDSASHEIFDYYIFDASGNGGRWVHQAWQFSDGAQTANQDEAMTWLVNADGNLEITITSSGDLHQLALNSFNDTLRPDLLVVVNGAYDSGFNNAWGERLLTQAQYETVELMAKVDLVDMNTIAGNYHYSWDPNEQIHLISDGTFDEYVNDGGVAMLDGSGTWSVDAVNDFFTLDWCAPNPAGCGEEDIVALESTAVDSGDIDGDGDTAETVYTFAGWWGVDPVTGLGSMFRDQLLIIQP